MSGLPDGYSQPVTPDEIEFAAIEGCIQYIIDNEVKFRYEGQSNTMAWWDNKGNQGKELWTLAIMVRGIVVKYVDEAES